MSARVAVLAVLACALACGAGSCAANAAWKRRLHATRRQVALGLPPREARGPFAAQGARGLGLRYAESLTRRLYTGSTTPLSPVVRAKLADKSWSGRRYLERASSAGCDKEVSTAGFCEAQARLGFAGALAGGLLGSFFSTALCAVLAVSFFAVGYSAPSRSVRSARRMRAVEAERHLSEMLEVVALGLRSGLSFDLSFALYGSHFDTGFARSCAMAHRRWALGLMTREESLRQLARSYDCEPLARMTESIVRSLRLGTSLTGILEEAAAQSRAVYRASLEERVAKAPVKMMLPTGTLILPAMLLMVIGPVLLELAGGF